MKLGIDTLEFGSLFAYTPRPDSSDPNLKKTMKNTKTWTTQYLKQDRMVRVQGTNDDIPMTRYVAEVISRKFAEIPFSDFFDENTALVPVPSSSQIPKGGLWVPERLAIEMVRKSIGNSVVPCLSRAKSIPKSSLSAPGNRPTPEDHYSSLSVSDTINDFDKAVLIDDVVTRGSTLIGSANKLHDLFPHIEIKGFAAVRTISDPSSFVKWLEPVKGKITLYLGGYLNRQP